MICSFCALSFSGLSSSSSIPSPSDPPSPSPSSAYSSGSAPPTSPLSPPDPMDTSCDSSPCSSPTPPLQCPTPKNMDTHFLLDSPPHSHPHLEHAHTHAHSSFEAELLSYSENAENEDYLHAEVLQVTHTRAHTNTHFMLVCVFLQPVLIVCVGGRLT